MKKVIYILIAICLMFCLVGCKPAYEGRKNYTETTSRLVPIVGQQDLYYDYNTKVVYIIFNECAGYEGYGYMSPYFADNGMPYIYDGGKLVKINE